MRTAAVCLVLGAFGLGLIAAPSFADPQQLNAYSDGPLSRPVRDAAENAVEFSMFNNWLNSNFESAPAENRQFLKEHLYSIIDSDIKQLHAREGAIFPTETEIVLTNCFAWATHMGVFGADLVLQRLNPDRAEEVTPTATVPPSFSLALQNDALSLSSMWGDWTVRFPYYFMVGDLRQYRAGNGVETQSAVISTGFGHHTGDDKYSQATLMVVYSPEANTDAFRKYWIEMFGLTGAKTASEPVNGLPRISKFDKESNMTTELVFPIMSKGAMAISYMGLAGTYEHNRPHFIDFLNALEVGSPEPEDEQADPDLERKVVR